MKKLITIQHCQSEQHVNGMIGGATDWPLTALGVEQAHNIGKALLEKLGADEKYVMYSSDLSRARQTAEIVEHYLNITPIFRQSLREQNFGSATGKSKEWFRANSMPQTKDVPMIYYRSLPDAETGEDVYLRVSEIVDEIEKSDADNIIVVGHGGSLQMFTACWLKIPVTVLENMAIIGSAGGVSFLSVRSDNARVLNQWNDTSFMRSL